MSTPLELPKGGLHVVPTRPAPKSKPLCRQCESLRFRRFGAPVSLLPVFVSYPLHQTRDSFLESLRLGCRLCIQISSFLNLDEPDQPSGPEPASDDIAFIYLRMSWSTCYDVSPTEFFAGCETVTAMLVESKARITMPRSTRLEVHERHVSKKYDMERRWPLLPEALHARDEEAAVRGDMSTGSLANFELARLWLSDCERYHDGPRGCKHGLPVRDGARPRILPARLINVENPQSPFLQETSSIPTSPRYAALSYCWGEGSRLTTTTSTLLAFQTSLPLSHLPKTFRDAIHATHKLGLPFLWIDGLCIVQDTPDEVAHQISIMDSVYQNAVLTIAAQGAPSAHHGLFVRRDARYTRPLQLPANDGTASLATIKVAKLKAQVSDYPQRRGWVLQETVLSRRILAYGTDEIRWSCIARNASESEPDPREGSGGLRLCPRLCLASRHHSDSETRRCFQRWYRLAEDFSRRELSVASDGLPALAGLAHYFFGAHLHDWYTYLAGMWQDDVQAGLAWYLVQSPWRAYKAAGLGGALLPTWSWAAAGQNAVEFRRESDRLDARDASFGVEMVRAEVTLCNALVSFGPVKAGGCIWLRGMLKRAELRWDWEYWMTEPPGGRSGPNDPRGRLHEPSGEQPRFPALVCRDGDGPDGGRPVGTAALDGDFAAGVIPDAGAGNADAATVFQEVNLRKEVWCLLVRARVHMDKWQSSCLVLERSAEGYRRIGLLFLRDLEWFGTLKVKPGITGLALVDKQGQLLVPETVKIF
ncbi:heterokaryon incompatibility protein-domain-containing protein [Schizothecium vesticola]|uniref:Heterokaryon incompatibility protein-domain-containing protein n=1 Tax=Schizothecium vesticola TaxID=314040 RepID=A0AA40F9N3_9PEZI|nr:heterokaryon incompatibility protein-domain-containing protein [Schizothecium vesticola]